MKKYVKAQIVAKNLPSGSYAAGCPTNKSGSCFWLGGSYCKKCERTE